MEVRAFEPFDFLRLQLQPMQANLSFGGQTIENGRALAQSTQAFTAVVNGDPIACIGLIELWPGRRMVWAYLAAGAGPHLVRLTWQVRRWLRYHGSGRIEAAVDPEFAASIGWAKCLGFVREGLMREWIPGKDFYLYARIGI